jgi:hypothetical protein
VIPGYGAPEGDVEAWIEPEHVHEHANPPENGNDGPSSWQPVDLGPYLDGTYTPPAPGVLYRTDGVGLLYPGKVHWCHGESESGKSWVAQVAAARELISGAPVLYVDHESGPADIVERLLALGVPGPVLRDRLHYVRPDVSAARDREAFDQLLAGRYALAVVDGVTDGMGLDSVSSLDNDEVAGWIRRMPRRIARRTGAAVVCIDHVTKSNDDRGRFAIGAQAKMAGLDGAAYVAEVIQPLGRGLVGCIGLRVAKDRPGSVRPHGGRWRKGDRTQEVARITHDATDPAQITVTIDPPEVDSDEQDAAPFRPTGYMQRLSRFVEQNPGCSRTAALNGTTGKKEHKLRALDALLAEGYLASVEAGDKRGTTQLTSLRAYRELLDEHGTGSGQNTADARPGPRSPYREGDRGDRVSADPVRDRVGTGSGPGLDLGKEGDRVGALRPGPSDRDRVAAGRPADDASNAA